MTGNGRPGYDELKSMSNEVLIKKLIYDTSHGVDYRKEAMYRDGSGAMNLRMLDGVAKHQHSEPPMSSTPPSSSSQQPITLNLSTSLHELANKMIASGWRCEGMRDPEQAYDWLTLATQRDEYMQDIPPEGQDFWKAALTKWQLWQIRRARGATD